MKYFAGEVSAVVTISLCMIVKNEEATLPRCLDSVGEVVDEIIVVDTGSTDATKAAARKYTDKIYDFAWVDDFSAARNFSYSKAQMDYILWLDADDVLLPADADALRDLKATLTDDIDGVMMRYNTGFDERGNVVFSYYRERLSRRSRGFLWQEPVHECLAVSGKILTSEISVTHTKKGVVPTGRNIRIYEALLARGEELSDRGTYYYARELKDNGRIDDAIVQFTRFLEGGRGWVEDNITACGELAKCRQIKGDRTGALEALLHSFVYDTPRAETCCQIGYIFKEQGQMKRAAYWFQRALTLEKPANNWGFTQQDCWGYIPAIECAVCYDRMGQYDKAEIYNNIALHFRPDSPSALHNKEYFDKRKVGDVHGD